MKYTLATLLALFVSLDASAISAAHVAISAPRATVVSRPVAPSTPAVRYTPTPAPVVIVPPHTAPYVSARCSQSAPVECKK